MNAFLKYFHLNKQGITQNAIAMTVEVPTLTIQCDISRIKNTRIPLSKKLSGASKR